MNQVINVDVSITVYAFLNTTTQRDSGLYLIYGMTFQENPFEIFAIMENKRNTFKKKKAHKMPRGCYDNNHSAKYWAGVEVLWKRLSSDNLEHSQWSWHRLLMWQAWTVHKDSLWESVILCAFNRCYYAPFAMTNYAIFKTSLSCLFCLVLCSYRWF